MRFNIRKVALTVLLTALLSVFSPSASTQSPQKRRLKGKASKAAAPVRSSSPSPRDNASSHNLNVEVKKTPFGKVIILTNRDKRPVTIRKITINDEMEPAKGGEDLLHSTKSWVSLPVELRLGDTLRVPTRPYRREIIYVDLDTDKGALTFKISK